MIGHLLGDNTGRAVEVVGNIGPAAIAAVDEAGGKATVLVAEVSSFQLSLTARRFHPRVSVLLKHHAGPSGLARLHGGVRFRQGAGVREPDRTRTPPSSMSTNEGAAPFADVVRSSAACVVLSV